ncbi:MAG: hypothetical protein AB1324_01095 [Candidatus Micrarchaeota archaeon]
MVLINCPAAFVREGRGLAKPLPLPGNLRFRRAKAGEVGYLKDLYESSWGGGITISREQLESQMERFPAGQIVGCEPGSSVPLTMINMMLGEFNPAAGIPAGYANLTGDRTFSTHIAPQKLLPRMAVSTDSVPAAFCVSIAVAKECQGKGYAIETLNYAIRFAEANGMAAVPYSAPRGFGSARRRLPELGIYDYLHMTKASPAGYEDYASRLDALAAHARIAAAFSNGVPRVPRAVSRSMFGRYQKLGDDPLDAQPGATAFARFLLEDAPALAQIYGRQMTIEDFVILSGRKMRDPVIGMHVENGARFIRDAKGGISAVFPESRPDDGAAAGYNIALTYACHPLFGHFWGKT